MSLRQCLMLPVFAASSLVFADDALVLQKKFFDECHVRYETAYVSELQDELVPVLDQAAQNCLKSKYNAYYLSKLGEVSFPKLPEGNLSLQNSLWQSSGNNGLNQSYPNSMTFLAMSMVAYQGYQFQSRIDAETMRQGLEDLTYRLRQNIDLHNQNYQKIHNNLAPFTSSWKKSFDQSLRSSEERQRGLEERVGQLEQMAQASGNQNLLQKSPAHAALNSVIERQALDEKWPERDVPPNATLLNDYARERYRGKYSSMNREISYQMGKVAQISDPSLKAELELVAKAAQKFEGHADANGSARQIVQDLQESIAARRYQSRGANIADQELHRDLVQRVTQFEARGEQYQLKRATVLDEINHGAMSSAHTELARESVTIADAINATAEQEFYSANLEFGDGLRDTAVQLLDIALGFVPVVSTAKDAYELFLGKNLLTGMQLTDTERALAGVGVATLGFVGLSKLPAVVETVQTIGRKIGWPVVNAVMDVSVRIIELAVKLGVKTKEEIKDLTKIAKFSAGESSELIARNIDQYAEAARLGAGPKLTSSHIANFKDGKYFNRKLEQDEIFYRYHGENNRTGKKFVYITKNEYSNEESLRNGVAMLEEWGAITEKSKIQVPEGTWVSEGLAASQKSITSSEIRLGGDYQSLLITPEIPVSWILNTTKAF